MKGLLGLTWWVALMVGCGSTNQRIARHDPQKGYRESLTTETPTNSDRLYIAMSFSGGGTRAAALSYGALQALHGVEVPVDGSTRRLTAEVDFISSVSGGSFTSAYFGLFGARIFEHFEARVLRRDLEWALVWRMLRPWVALRLLASTYDRIHVAQALYDETIFREQTFAAMNGADGKANKPFVMINGTNISQGNRFEFTQDRFDLIGADLDVYPVGHAVAASSAFPAAFNPVLLLNYPRPPNHQKVPDWVVAAEKNGHIDPIAYRRAQEWRAYDDKAGRPYLHVLDGGLADNTGTRAIIESIDSRAQLRADKTAPSTRSINHLLNDRKIKRLLIIVVNAKPAKDSTLDRSRMSPGIIDVMSAAGTTAMDLNTDDAIPLLELVLKQYTDPMPGTMVPLPTAIRSGAALPKADTGCQTRIEMPGLDDPDAPALDGPVAYLVDVSFARVQEAARRTRLEGIGTRLALDDDDVDLLIAAGRTLVEQDPCFVAFMRDTGARSAP